jgi:hypothetical protein
MDSRSQGGTETKLSATVRLGDAETSSSNRICVREETFPYVNSVITLQNYTTKYYS